MPEGRDHNDAGDVKVEPMPLYEYQCERCDARVEVLQRLGDDPPGCCECAGDGSPAPMKKMMSASSFLLKGSGWAHDSYGLK